MTKKSAERLVEFFCIREILADEEDLGGYAPELIVAMRELEDFYD